MSVSRGRMARAGDAEDEGGVLVLGEVGVVGHWRWS
jgi:hypothetical protein